MTPTSSNTFTLNRAGARSRWKALIEAVESEDEKLVLTIVEQIIVAGDGRNYEQALTVSERERDKLVDSVARWRRLTETRTKALADLELEFEFLRNQLKVARALMSEALRKTVHVANEGRDSDG